MEWLTENWVIVADKNTFDFCTRLQGEKLKKRK